MEIEVTPLKDKTYIDISEGNCDYRIVASPIDSNGKCHLSSSAISMKYDKNSMFREKEIIQALKKDSRIILDNH